MSNYRKEMIEKFEQRKKETGVTGPYIFLGTILICLACLITISILVAVNIKIKQLKEQENFDYFKNQLPPYFEHVETLTPNTGVVKFRNNYILIRSYGLRSQMMTKIDYKEEK